MWKTEGDREREKKEIFIYTHICSTIHVDRTVAGCGC